MAKKQYAKIDKRLYRVPDDKPFYHGTQGDELKHIDPGIHLSSELNYAKKFAKHGSFYGGDTGEKGRVVEFRVGIPNEQAPRISFTSEFKKDILNIMDDDGYHDYDKHTDLNIAYIDQADEIAIKEGYDAYYTGEPLEGDNSDDGQYKMTGDLRVLDPKLIRIVNQHTKKPAKGEVKFRDLPSVKPRSSTKKRGRGSPKR